MWSARTHRSGWQPVKVISVTIGEARVRLHKTRFQLILPVPDHNVTKNLTGHRMQDFFYVCARKLAKK